MVSARPRGDARRAPVNTERTARQFAVAFYEHCVRAIEHGLTQGAHGLPLIGCGDWMTA
ncbi:MULTISPECIES: hypothetical protein [unclassified Caballeronia]|uniref:hypothetical protein n=1 Tax=unclassified Caballeronia TaxID=2646786 RepID=UPI003ECD5523